MPYDIKLKKYAQMDIHFKNKCKNRLQTKIVAIIMRRL
jgi:hypothetical protein